jgi:repressor LexA
MPTDEYHSEISVSHRIKQLRLAKGLTQKAFAASLGIVQGYLSGIERGKKIPSHTLLMALCHIYGVRAEWLSGGNGAKFAEMTQPDDHFSAGMATGIPLLKSIPEGFPDQLGSEDICGEISLPDIHGGCFAIIADGDFMAPTIRDGDLVIFKPGKAIANRSIILLNNKWGEAILRRCRVKGDEVYFSAENSVYAPFKADANTRILGSVVDIWRKVKI